MTSRAQARASAITNNSRRRNLPGNTAYTPAGVECPGQEEITTQQKAKAGTQKSTGSQRKKGRDNPATTTKQKKASPVAWAPPAGAEGGDPATITIQNLSRKQKEENPKDNH